MNIQARLQYKNARLKRKLYDNAIRKKSLDIRAIHLTVDEDRYSNKEYAVQDHGTIDAVIKIPGGDLQAFQGQRNNNSSYNSGVSVYSLLPIECFVPSDSNLNIGDILLYKILRETYDTENVETFIQALQVSNCVSKATTTILYNVYIVAPYTFNLDEYPQITTLLEQYKLEPIELW